MLEICHYVVRDFRQNLIIYLSLSLRAKEVFQLANVSTTLRQRRTCWGIGYHQSEILLPLFGMLINFNP